MDIREMSNSTVGFRSFRAAHGRVFHTGLTNTSDRLDFHIRCVSHQFILVVLMSHAEVEWEWCGCSLSDWCAIRSTFFSSWTFFCSHLTAQRALNTSQDFQWASVAMCLQISRSHTMSEICSIYRYYHWHKIQTLKSSQFFCRRMRSFWFAKLLLHFKYWICDCRSAFFITLNLKRYPGSCFRRFPTYLYVHRYLGKIPHWK